jgi:hypothetical protein
MSGRFGNRPSPHEKATLYAAGFEDYGHDGNIWKVVVTKNDVYRWQKVIGAVKPTNRQQTKKKSVKKHRSIKKSL